MKVAYDVSRELVRRGHDVHVCTTDADGLTSRIRGESVRDIEGITVNYFHNLSMFLPKIWKVFVTPSAVRFAKTQLRSFDIIHMHEFRTFQNSVIHHFANYQRIPYVLQAHGSMPRFSRLERMKVIYDMISGKNILEKASALIALSSVETKQYKDYGVPREKIDVIPNGVDLSEYSRIPPRGTFKIKFGIPPDKQVLLYLGRLHETKGIEYLLRAFASLIGKGENRQVVLVLAGPDDGFEAKILSLVDDLRLRNRVFVVGPVYGSLKLAAFTDATAYVLPSTYETFPVSILEAYACGKPVVACAVGGINDLVQTDKTGILVKPGDVDQLAEAIQYVFDHPDQASMYGSRGRNLITTNFTIEILVDKLESLYESIKVAEHEPKGHLEV
jgi:glycosyltransferase involved in cell wall biosynthesis